MSDKTLRKALELNQPYNRYHFRYLGAKLWI
jgi:hypothetical protein